MRCALSTPIDVRKRQLALDKPPATSEACYGAFPAWIAFGANVV